MITKKETLTAEEIVQLSQRIYLFFLVCAGGGQPHPHRPR